MPRSPTSRLLLSVLLLAACGDDGGGAGTAPRGLSGPPMQEVTRLALPSGARGMLVRAQSACRLTLIVEGLDEGPRTYPARRLAAGEDVRIWWRDELEADTTIPAEPPEGAAEAGRTVDASPRLSFAFEDVAILSAGFPFFMRPGTPQRAVRDHRPPLRPEAVPFGSALELCTFAIADLSEGTLRIVPGPGGHRVVPAPDEVTPPDQVRYLKLLLRVEPAE